MTKSIGSKGMQMTLNDRGKKLLWLKLKDNIERSLKDDNDVYENLPPNTRPNYREAAIKQSNRINSYTRNINPNVGRHKK